MTLLFERRRKNATRLALGTAVLFGAIGGFFDVPGGAAPARAERLLNWFTVDAGGGDVANGYSVRGTVGQPDGGVPSAAGAYQIRGGFWRGAIALTTRLIFSDGFESGDDATWSVSLPLDLAAAPVPAAASGGEVRRLPAHD
jgi:hypothetical protein